MCFALWALTLVLFTNTGLVYIPVFIAYFLVLQVRLRLIMLCLRGRAMGRSMMRVRALTVRSLMFCTTMNRVYGPLLVIFLCGHMPLNETLLTIVFERHLLLSVRILLMLIVLGEYTVLIMLHFLAAKGSKQLHFPYKRMMSVNIRIRRMNPSTRLKLTCHIQAFFVKKCYGFTYACFGLVSFKTLFQVSPSLDRIECNFVLVPSSFCCTAKS